MARPAVRRLLGGAKRKLTGTFDLRARLRGLQAEVTSLTGPGIGSFGRYRVRYTDPLVFYMELKDIWHHRIYDPSVDRQDPLLLDCGSHIGMSILYLKDRFPRADLTGFEPDPAVFEILSENLESNGVRDVELINAAIATEAGTASFIPDVRDAGRLAEDASEKSIRVRTEPLSKYLDRPVDFLKMNIEGAELAVLRESRDVLHQIEEMVVEYHGEPGHRQYLHSLLDLLDSKGFRYLVHDFDAESVATTKPPFRLTPETRYVLLVYAKQLV